MPDRFKIVLGGDRSTSQLVREAGYDYVNPYITDENFPLVHGEIHEATLELVQMYRKQEKLKLDEILQEILGKRKKLIRPTLECALKFGQRYPDEQRHRRSIVFIHEPFLAPDGGRGALVLYGSAKNRSLGLDWMDFSSEAGSFFGFLYSG